MMPMKYRFAVAGALSFLAGACFPDDLPPASRWAYDELTNMLKRITGEVPEVSIVLPGSVDAAMFSGDLDALADNDGYAVRKRDGRLYFVASCPKGHVNGVHRWLERNSDVIWPRPAGDPCFFTKKPLSEFKDSDYIDVPAFRIRYFGGGARDNETRRYLTRNAMNPMGGYGEVLKNDPDSARKYGMIESYRDVFGGGHDMESRWFPRSEYFAKHPEYWMLVDGVRWTGLRSNFCESNPDFAAAYSKSVEEKIRGLPPSVKVISINMEDSRITCQCENCLAPIRLDDGTVVTTDDAAYRSTRFFIFFNKVARHIAKIRPDLQILQFAYMHLAVPPKVKVERNVTLKFCPYPRNMRESVVEGPSNANWRKRIDGWLDNTPELYWREYYFCGCIHFPRPIADTAVTDLRYIRKRGVREVYTDSPGRFGDNDENNAMYGLNRPRREFYDMNGMEAWVMQKLFWDPGQDPQTLRREFLSRTFGPAAVHVGEFYGLIRDSWNSDSMPSSFSDNPLRSAAHYIVGKGIADKCQNALAKAESLADLPERKAWIAAMRKNLKEWIDEAPNYSVGEIRIPFLKAKSAPTFDFSDEVWGRAAKFPVFRLLRSKRAEDLSGSRVRMYSDGRAFVIGVEVDKGDHPPVVVKRAGGEAFPRGDKTEFSFVSKQGGYYQFAFDCIGQKYEAFGLDSSWSCDWQVKVQSCRSKWMAVARIPFDAIGFAPHVDPKLRFLPMFSIVGTEKRTRSLSWQGGVPHAPASWGEIVVDIEQ